MSQRIPELRDQQIIFPELLSERVEQGPHAARFFRYLVNVLNLDLQRTSALGTPPYCRNTLLASIFFAMFNGHFESKQIVNFLKDSIGAQWILQGMTIPSYMTVERVINALLMEVESFFIQILELCNDFNYGFNLAWEIVNIAVHIKDKQPCDSVKLLDDLEIYYIQATAM
jgi:hypothetical protein